MKEIYFIVQLFTLSCLLKTSPQKCFVLLFCFAPPTSPNFLLERFCLKLNVKDLGSVSQTRESRDKGDDFVRNLLLIELLFDLHEFHAWTKLLLYINLYLCQFLSVVVSADLTLTGQYLNDHYPPTCLPGLHVIMVTAVCISSSIQHVQLSFVY